MKKIRVVTHEAPKGAEVRAYLRGDEDGDILVLQFVGDGVSPYDGLVLSIEPNAVVFYANDLAKVLGIDPSKVEVRREQ